jgi:hypothetical protein
MADQTIHSRTRTSRRDAASFGKRQAPPVDELKLRGTGPKSGTRLTGPALRLAPTLLAMTVLLGVGHDRVIAAASYAEGCRIKATIDASGEKLYRLADDDGYGAAKVSFLKGGRWFCTEADARDNGWRRAGT